MLIWRGNERIAGSHVSLKRQEPTPKGEELSHSQSLSPLCEDINIKRPHTVDDLDRMDIGKGLGYGIRNLFWS
jgi:hypothetical protein